MWSQTAPAALSSRIASLRLSSSRSSAKAPRTAVIECAHKKGTGSVKNGRDSNPKYMGVKKFGEEQVTTGNIIVRQRGSKFHAGEGVGTGKDFTLFALRDGEVHFKVGADKKKFVTVVDAIDRRGRADGLPTRRDKRRAMFTPRDDVRWAEETGEKIEARAVVATVAPSKKSSASGPPKGTYRQVNKVRYDNSALLAMDAIMASKGELDLAAAEAMYSNVQDGKRVTPTECATLEFVARGGGGKYLYKCTPEAKAFLLARVAAERAKYGDAGAR